MKLGLGKKVRLPLRISASDDGTVPSQSSTLFVDGKTVGLVEVNSQTRAGKTVLHLHFRPSSEFSLSEYKASKSAIEWWIHEEAEA